MRILMIALLWTFSALAEYRVFVLKITSEEKERLVTTVFDHYQYPMYHGLKLGETIEIWDSWKCLGRTAPNRDFCPNPRAEAPGL